MKMVLPTEMISLCSGIVGKSRETSWESDLDGGEVEFKVAPSVLLVYDDNAQS